MADEKRALKAIDEGLRLQLGQSPKRKERFLEADLGFINPALEKYKKEFTNEQAAKAALTAVGIAVKYKLNPDEFDISKLKKRGADEAFNIIIGKGNEGLGKIAKYVLPEGFEPEVGYSSRESFMKNRTPDQLGLSYRQGPFRASVRANPRTGAKEGRIEFSMPLGGKAKGGKVKQYAKGGGVRKPRLK
tara:strand:+ start:204 stop:770 length:567 start_codon:yes stop_codon:yes gene_type:complete